MRAELPVLFRGHSSDDILAEQSRNIVTKQDSRAPKQYLCVESASHIALALECARFSILTGHQQPRECAHSTLLGCMADGQRTLRADMTTKVNTHSLSSQSKQDGKVINGRQPVAWGARERHCEALSLAAKWRAKSGCSHTPRGRGSKPYSPPKFGACTCPCAIVPIGWCELVYVDWTNASFWSSEFSCPGLP